MLISRDIIFNRVTLYRVNNVRSLASLPLSARTRSFKTVKLPARVKTLLCARLLTNGIGYKEEEEAGNSAEFSEANYSKTVQR